MQLYIKAEGILQSLSTYLDGPTQVKDILKQFKLDQKQSGPVHLEVIARIQEKTVLCLHLNETTITKGFKCKTTSYPLETVLRRNVIRLFSF